MRYFWENFSRNKRGALCVLGAFLIQVCAGCYHGTFGNLLPYFTSYMKQVNKLVWRIICTFVLNLIIDKHRIDRWWRCYDFCSWRSGSGDQLSHRRHDLSASAGSQADTAGWMCHVHLVPCTDICLHGHKCSSGVIVLCLWPPQLLLNQCDHVRSGMTKEKYTISFFSDSNSSCIMVSKS